MKAIARKNNPPHLSEAMINAYLEGPSLLIKWKYETDRRRRDLSVKTQLRTFIRHKTRSIVTGDVLDLIRKWELFLEVLGAIVFGRGGVVLASFVLN